MEIQTFKIQITDVNANNRDHDQNLKKRIKMIRTFTRDLRTTRNGLQLINLLITVEERGKTKSERRKLEEKKNLQRRSRIQIKIEQCKKPYSGERKWRERKEMETENET